MIEKGKAYRLGMKTAQERDSFSGCHEFSATGISKTWLSDVNQNYIKIIAYRLISPDRLDRCGGGAGFYLLDTPAFQNDQIFTP